MVGHGNTQGRGGDLVDAIHSMPGVYAGGAFHDSLPNGKVSGLLRADGDQLRLEFDGGHAELPLSGLQAAFGGAADRLIFFTHPEKPGWTFFTADRQILSDSTLNFAYELGEQLARLRGSRRLSAALWLGALGAVVALVVALVLGVLLNREAMIDAVAGRIPPAVEKEMGDRMMEELQGSLSFVEDRKVLGDLDEMAGPIRVASGASALKLYILESPGVNAFAAPGGHIVVTSGLLLEADCAEEVLGVLAHETAHAAKRHNVRIMLADTGLFVLIGAFFGDTGNLVSRFAGLGRKLMRSRYSRDQEREADRLGFEYLCEAGIDPRPMMAFFKRQEQRMTRSGQAGADENYLNTHPSFSERLSTLQRWLEETGEKREFTEVGLDYEAYKARLRETLRLP